MNVRPFRGYLYDAAVVGDAGACIAPPYDVIDDDAQRALHNRSPYNIAHVTRAQVRPDDSDTDNVYTRAGATFRDFVAGGALAADPTERMYAYAQTFTVGEATYRRLGFVALGELEDYGGAIKPHEQTLAGPKADRLNLMRATHAQIGQIFMLYSEPEKRIDAILERAAAGTARLQYRDDEGVLHEIFDIAGVADLETIARVMADHHVFIADGHHRYETALAYHRENPKPATACQMMTFVNTHNDGLVVLPTHRLVHDLADFDAAGLLAALREQFDVGRMAFADVVEKKAKFEMMLDTMQVDDEAGAHTVGLYLGDDAFYVATLRDAAAMDAVAGDHSAAWRGLDVAILHKLILEQILGIDDAALAAQTHLEYIKDFGPATLRAIDAVDAGRAQALFLLSRTRAEQIEQVALAGEKMPQKSTFFYPKIFSGLVVNVLE